MLRRTVLSLLRLLYGFRIRQRKRFKCLSDCHAGTHVDARGCWFVTGAIRFSCHHSDGLERM